MLTHYRKSYEIVGTTTEHGEVHCLACLDPADLEERPVFLDQADDLTCDGCGERLDA